MWCHISAGVGCLALAIMVVIPALDRELPFVREGGSIRPPDPLPGQAITVVWRGHRSRECPGTVRRWIVDSQGTMWRFADAAADYRKSAQRDGILPRTFTLPDAIAPGPATYHSVASFTCNWTQAWWPIVGEAPPLLFAVGEPIAVQRGPRGEKGDRGETGPPGVSAR